MTMSRDDLRQVALDAARAGAQTVRGWIQAETALEAERKGVGDYVTRADRAAEATILAVLHEQTPEIAILAEEAGGTPGDRYWAVDPIDGTTNFLRGFHTGVGVSVGLMEEGRPVAGAVVAPRTADEWSAARGLGAHDHRGRRLTVSDNPTGVVATGFPFRRPENRPRYLPVLLRAVDSFEDVRRPGAASLDCVNVAAGVWDGYFELGLSVWDIAAGGLIVTEAGGVVTDWRGHPTDVYVTGDILAGGPAWHERMLQIAHTAAAAAEASSS